MNIPRIQNLTSQTFRFNFIEFVWLFPHDKEKKEEFSFRINHKGKIEVVDAIVVPVADGFMPEGNLKERIYKDAKSILEDKEPLPVYKNFLNGQQLVELTEEAKTFWEE
jgi:hypothetical protein